MMFPIFISCPKGLEYMLADELSALKISVEKISPQGVYTTISLEDVYRICIWSRLAGRVQLILLEDKDCRSVDELYRVCREYNWGQVFPVNKSLAIAFHGTSSVFRNTLFGAQVVKDAVVDFFKQENGLRPDIERKSPDVFLHAYLKHDKITVSLDLVGYSLHQRGYRMETGVAPLKEHIAAAMLIRSRWPQLMKEGFAFQDICCGAGTLVIEAAMMALNIAPGLLRQDQAFQHWFLHDESLWQKVRQEAASAATNFSLPIQGSDKDAKLIEYAKENAKRAGVSQYISWRAESLVDARPVSEKGLMVTNPPYGVRLGDESKLASFYKSLGRALHQSFQAWHAAILTPNVSLAKEVGLRAHKQYSLYNGALLCKLYCFDLNEKNVFLEEKRPLTLSTASQSFANRLQKNHQHLGKWAKRNQVTCYRIYDADLPEYAFAIDLYHDHVVLQEYAPPQTVDAQKAQRRRLEVQHIIPEILNIKPEQLVIKTRAQQKGYSQYEKLDETKRRLIVQEGNARFYVNLTDYLDTGLFLDHRPLRLHFYNTLKSQMRFLNCFSYTASASVHAALAGAMTVSVDLSKTYLAWAEDNFQLNGIDTRKHQFVHFDCLEWLKLTSDKFDVIFLDPPSFSNSKRMTETLDVQRDHEKLIDACLRLLLPGGVLYFSTNLKTFKLAPAILQRYMVKDITPSTIDLDFKRHANIHRCYQISESH